MKKKPDWPKLLEAFEDSGLTHFEFCSKHGISLSSFQQRLYRSRREARGGGGFTRLSVEAAPPASDCWAEMGFPGGVSLRFHDAPDARYLAELLTLLRP